jgi:hypothetical protein
MISTTASPRRARKRRSLASDAAQVERDLAQLHAMPLADLRVAWLARFGAQPPKLKTREILLRIMAWRIQADVFGDHTPEVKRKLTQLAAAFEKDPNRAIGLVPDLKPGIVLAREWKGVVHRVLVQHEGFIYAERHYRSLTDIARTITGSRWSGPRFFGIEPRARRGLASGDTE